MEYIAIPSKINFQDYNVLSPIIKNLRSLNNFICLVKENSLILEKLKKGNISKIERKLKIKNLRDSIMKKRFRIKDFFTLAKELDFSDEQTYSFIGSIKNSDEHQRAGHTSKSIDLPNLDELEKLGYLLGWITGDGHLSRTNINLDNNDIEVQDKYREYLKEIFNIDSKIKKNHTCWTVTDCAGKTFVRFI